MLQADQSSVPMLDESAIEGHYFAAQRTPMMDKVLTDLEDIFVSSNLRNIPDTALTTQLDRKLRMVLDTLSTELIHRRGSTLPRGNYLHSAIAMPDTDAVRGDLFSLLVHPAFRHKDRPVADVTLCIAEMGGEADAIRVASRLKSERQPDNVNALLFIAGTIGGEHSVRSILGLLPPDFYRSSDPRDSARASDISSRAYDFLEDLISGGIVALDTGVAVRAIEPNEIRATMQTLHERFVRSESLTDGFTLAPLRPSDELF